MAIAKLTLYTDSLEVTGDGGRWVVSLEPMEAAVLSTLGEARCVTPACRISRHCFRRIVAPLTVARYVARLRQKLGPGVIETIATRGYRLLVELQRRSRMSGAQLPLTYRCEPCGNKSRAPQLSEIRTRMAKPGEHLSGDDVRIEEVKLSCGHYKITRQWLGSVPIR